MNRLKVTDPELFGFIEEETERQNFNFELIASENFASLSTIEAMGTVLTNKYAEGYPGKRYYGGCEHVDKIEDLARERAKKLFGADWVNVQPHSGASANAAVYLAYMKPGDTLLGLDLAHGGHLTHGSPVNFSGITYNAQFYGVDQKTGRINLDRVLEIAREVQPRMISIGASAYTRDFDYALFKEIADEVGAFLWMDMAHTAGLIAAGELNDPLPYADVITTTTHKTLRGPRGGMILVGKDHENRLGVTAPKSGRVKMISEVLDSSIFPGTQGGPLMHVIAAKATAFAEALKPEFKLYQQQVKRNAKQMAAEFSSRGYNLVSGGTDNHLILVDLRNKKLNGKIAEEALDRAGITVNKNMVPFDDQSPFVTSGIRIGTPALTTRGFREDEFTEVVRLIDKILQNPSDEKLIVSVKSEVREMCKQFPLYDFAAIS